MRRITFTIILCVFLSTILVLHTTTPTNAFGATGMQATETSATAPATSAYPCPMSFYVDLMQNDLRSIDDTPGTDMGSPKLSVKFLLKIATIRHKYEDMDVPRECLPTKQQAIAVMANYMDLVNINLASLVDTENAQSYNDQLDAQIKRLADEKAALGRLIPNLS